MGVNLWSSPEHALEYLQNRKDSVPHRTEGEAVILEILPANVRRILDLGTGDGRLLAIVKQGRPQVDAVGIDFSPAMLEQSRKRFAADPSTKIIEHNLDSSLPELGTFDAVISSFAIHHLVHPRKRELYTEIFAVLNPGGVFCNLEHVASPTQRLHEEFLHRLNLTPEAEDPSNKLLDMEAQLGWLREIGFTDVDCYWKWRELALLSGRKPEA
jgi:tRNA (cmo5U34)-methyltransferase